MLKVERANIAALRSAARKLKKSREESIKCVEKYKCEIDEAKKSVLFVRLWQPTFFCAKCVLHELSCNFNLVT